MCKASYQSAYTCIFSVVIEHKSETWIICIAQTLQHTNNEIFSIGITTISSFHFYSKSFFTILALFVFRLIHSFIHVIIISSGISGEKLNIACIRGVSRETSNYKNNKSINKLSMIIRGRSTDLRGIYKYSKQRAEMAARAMTTNRLNGY